MFFSCRKYVILEQPSWKLPSALSKNGVSIFIYFCINICFCIRQANKICTLLSSHLLAVTVFSVRCVCFMRGILFSFPIQTLTPPNRVNFCELRYYKAVRCSEGTLKLVVKRSLSTCQPRSQCFSLPIYFLQSFWVQYFASNHMSSQTIYPRLLPWHYNDRQYQKNIVHC